MADVFARGASVLHSHPDPDTRPAVAQKPNHAGPVSPWLRYVSWGMPVLLLIVWELFARLGALSPNVLPAPSKVALTAFELVKEGRLIGDMAVKIGRAHV